MASKHRRNQPASVLSQSKFSESLLLVSRRYPLFTVFDDFLTMAIAACTRNLETHVSWYEDEYLQTIEKYKDSDSRHEFPKAFGYLVEEMEARVNTDEGNDVLGEFFQQNISNGRNGQYFTPSPVCSLISSVTKGDVAHDKVLRILDTSCGSGRMLLSAAKEFGPRHEYYGIDIDPTCAKMCALNLFFNGVFHSEVMCANALLPGDFVISYKISFLPLGIFKVENKEESLLWHRQQHSFTRNGELAGKDIVLDKRPFAERKKDDSAQLDLFNPA